MTTAREAWKTNRRAAMDLLRIGRSSQDMPLLKSRPRIYRIPKIHDELISDEQNKYLIIKGGRGGFKTASFVCSLIEYSYLYEECAFVFAREIAGSIADSVYATVKGLIGAIDKTTGKCRKCRADGKIFEFSSDDFTIGKTEIVNERTGVRFIFTGLRATGGKTAMSQLNKIKGTYKIRVLMLEEGQDLTEDSLNVLLPTANRGGDVLLIDPKNVDEEETILDEARFFVAMNPNKEIDPVVSKFKPFCEAGQGVIAHINMCDIAGVLSDTGPVERLIIINSEKVPVMTEPDMRDEQLLNQMELERNLYHFAHIWEGAAYHKFAGLAWSMHHYTNDVLESNVEVFYSWLDPSHKGGDLTALSMIGRRKDTGKIIAFGRAWKSAWNMLPARDGIGEMYKKWRPEKFFYEDNGIGSTPQSILGAYGIPVIGITTVLNKEDKIYRAAAFTVELVEICKNLSDAEWVKNIEEYTDEAEHDDAPDSLASLIIQTGMIKEKVKF